MAGYNWDKATPQVASSEFARAFTPLRVSDPLDPTDATKDALKQMSISAVIAAGASQAAASATAAVEPLVEGKANTSDLVAATGSTGLGHKSPLAGSSSTTVYASFAARRANAKSDFDAAFDGVTDDTAAIQAGINAVSAAGGGTLELPAGTAIVGTLTLPQDVTLEGQGKFQTVLKASAGLNAPLIDRPGTNSGVINRGGVQRLTIIGSGLANTDMIGIRSVYTNRAVYRDIDIFGTYRGMWIENVWQDILDNIHVHGGGTYQSYIGFYFAPKAAISGVSNAVIAVGCMAQGVFYCGWRLENYDGSKFTACEGTDGSYGWFLGSPSTGTEACQFGHFVNCLGDTNSVNNWRIDKGNAAGIRQAQFANCWGGTAGVENLYIGGASQLMFSNLQLVGAAEHAINLQLASRISITGCNIRDYATVAGRNGIYLGNSQAVAITGNQIYTSKSGSGVAVVEGGTSDYNVVSGNALLAGATLSGAHSVAANNVSI